MRGVGGTRNCDWWFTDEAVLIDTAGRYTTQERTAAVDASAWDGFLALLRKSRPRRPINGVLLTVSIQDLLQQTPAERKDHAAKLRARMQELHEKLGVRAAGLRARHQGRPARRLQRDLRRARQGRARPGLGLQLPLRADQQPTTRWSTSAPSSPRSRSACATASCR